MAFESEFLGPEQWAASAPDDRPLLPISYQELDDYRFLLNRHIDLGTLERARLIGLGWESHPHTVMLTLGWVKVMDYTNALADELQVASCYSQPTLFGGVTIDATSSRPTDVARAVRTALLLGSEVQLYSPLSAEIIRPDYVRLSDALDAVDSLRSQFPEVSADRPAAEWMHITGFTIIGFFAGIAVVDTRLVLLTIGVVASVPFAGVVLQRLMAFFSFLTAPRLDQPKTAGRWRYHELPIYTILIPLLDEAELIPDLIDALITLDYPAIKLDVIMILEDTDEATHAAAHAAGLPGFVRVVSVPNLQPKTKPKALNYGLRFARGDFVVVYDAEDIPEPDQLRLALDAFYNQPTIDCLQARLNIYNGRSNWLTRQFALEYTVLFDGLLPALVRLAVPIPLGGTSNHYRMDVLRRSGGWDPFNVTEDADIAIRLQRQGFRVGMLNSTTWEQAPEDLATWLPQRTRWIKGWMQTYLAHMRQPSRLWRDLGTWRFVGFQCLFGGYLLSALLHPFVYVFLLVALVIPTQNNPIIESLQTIFTHITIFGLFVGFLTAMLFAATTALGRRWPKLALHTFLMPPYWLLASVAAFRAAYQLFTAPYHWEKTAHNSRGADFHFD
ncbi:MAG: glycosyltransferase [Hyphomicrobiaceae bacterium]